MSDQPKEEKKPVDYLKMAKKYENMTAREWEQTSIACSLIFIGEQLARIAEVMEKEEESFSIDEAVKIWGVPK